MPLLHAGSCQLGLTHAVHHAPGQLVWTEQWLPALPPGLKPESGGSSVQVGMGGISVHPGVLRQGCHGGWGCRDRPFSSPPGSVSLAIRVQEPVVGW